MRAFLLLFLVMLTACGTERAHPSQSFASWLEDFKSEAVQKNISPRVIAEAFDGVDTPNDEVLLLDHKQPEKTQSFDAYVTKIVSTQRIGEGKAHWQSHQALLGRIEARYGVPAPILLALWGIESKYGEHQGNFSVIESLATLAYDGRRSAFFREQLMGALIILQEEHKPADELVGSWAGAMGQIQFMPSSFLRFAVDFDGDGKKDIWNNDADALASMANYLSKKGWNGKEGWGMEVQLPPGKNWKNEKETLPLSQWQSLGVRSASGADLPQSEAVAHLVFPDSNYAIAFLVYNNYNILMDWNHSTYFATSAGLLADAIGKP